MSTEDPQARLTELEIRHAFLEERVAALDEVLVAFTRRVESLEVQLDQLRARVAELVPAAPGEGLASTEELLADAGPDRSEDVV